MKKLLILVTLMAFAVAAPFAMAQKGDVKKKEPPKCCIKGECKDAKDDGKDWTKADCKKAGGKIVKDCKTCKPEVKKPAKEDKKPAPAPAPVKDNKEKTE